MHCKAAKFAIMFNAKTGTRIKIFQKLVCFCVLLRLPKMLSCVILKQANRAGCSITRYSSNHSFNPLVSSKSEYNLSQVKSWVLIPPSLKFPFFSSPKITTILVYWKMLKTLTRFANYMFDFLMCVFWLLNLANLFTDILDYLFSIRLCTNVWLCVNKFCLKVDFWNSKVEFPKIFYYIDIFFNVVLLLYFWPILLQC